MAYTQDQLEAAVTEHAEEGLYLELKRSAALARSDAARSDLVVDDALEIAEQTEI
jgi:hypothetical protein